MHRRNTSGRKRRTLVGNIPSDRGKHMSEASLEAAVNRAVRALVEVARQADDDALRHAAERAADAVLSAWEDAE